MMQLIALQENIQGNYNFYRLR